MCSVHDRGRVEARRRALGPRSVHRPRAPSNLVQSPKCPPRFPSNVTPGESDPLTFSSVPERSWLAAIWVATRVSWRNSPSVAPILGVRAPRSFANVRSDLERYIVRFDIASEIILGAGRTGRVLAASTPAV